MSNFLVRLQEEHDELDAKIKKLEHFLIVDEKSNEIGQHQRELLFIQYDAMKTYIRCLSYRLAHLTVPGESKG